MREARLARFERATFGSGDQHSIHWATGALDCFIILKKNENHKIIISNCSVLEKNPMPFMSHSPVRCPADTSLRLIRSLTAFSVRKLNSYYNNFHNNSHFSRKEKRRLRSPCRFSVFREIRKPGTRVRNTDSFLATKVHKEKKRHIIHACGRTIQWAAGWPEGP